MTDRDASAALDGLAQANHCVDCRWAMDTSRANVFWRCKKTPSPGDLDYILTGKPSEDFVDCRERRRSLTDPKFCPQWEPVPERPRRWWQRWLR